MNTFLEKMPLKKVLQDFETSSDQIWLALLSSSSMISIINFRSSQLDTVFGIKFIDAEEIKVPKWMISD